jgi:homoserine acetyltransferase
MTDQTQTIERGQAEQALPPVQLQRKLHDLLGITEQLAAAGGSMTRRKLFHFRRRRHESVRWHIAMNHSCTEGSCG